MSSSHRQSRVVRGAHSDEDVYVLGDGPRRTLDLPAAVATAQSLVENATRRAEEIEAEAATLLDAARAEALTIRARAREEGLAQGSAEGMAAGREQLEIEAAGYLELIRRAAEEGRAIRDGIVEQSTAVIAKAAMQVARRMVGEYYEADPGRTAVACEQAVRAASNQQIISIRVHPSAVHAVQARLVDLDALVVSDDAVQVGGCIVDLEGGRIDASLDARFSMMELALERSAGGSQ